MSKATDGSARRVLVLLVALNILNYLDRQLLSAFMVDIRRDVGLSYFQFTLLAGLMFSIFYALAGVPAGMLADRVHRPRLIASAVAVWSALTAVTGLTANFVQMGAARAFAAVGEATLTPTSVSLLSDKYPPERQGAALSLFYLGLPLGAGGSFLVAGMLGPIIGWRGCFLLLGAIGAIAALAMLPMRDAERIGYTPRPSGGALRDILRTIAATPGLGMLFAASVLLFFSQGAAIIDQEWLVRERGFAVRNAQLIFGGIFIGAGIIGTWLGGKLSDRAAKGSIRGRLRFLAGVALLSAALNLFYRLSPATTPVFYGAAFIGGMLFMAPFGTVMASIGALTPPHLRATMVAVGIMLMTVLGTAGGNAATGWLADLFTARGGGEPLTTSLLIVHFVALPACGLFWLAARCQPTPPAEAALRQADCPKIQEYEK
jgi:MFS family permease